MMRATVSGRPPAEYGIMNFIDRLGVCACACRTGGIAETRLPVHTSDRNRRFVMASLMDIFPQLHLFKLLTPGLQALLLFLLPAESARPQSWDCSWGRRANLATVAASR